MMEAAEHAATSQARVNHTRGAAAAHMLSGDRSATMEALGAAAQFADSEDLGGAAGFSHLQMAVVAAMMGRDREIGAHLTRAGELGPQNAGFHGMSALAHGAAGHVDAARASAAELDDANAFWQGVGHAAVALALVDQNDLDGAMEELSAVQAGDPLGNAVRALALDKMGRDAEADAARSEVMNLRQFALANPFHGFAKFLASDD